MKIDKSNIDKYIIGTELDCCGEDLTSIESIPDYITSIYIYNNELTSLPKLPDGLVSLYCGNNNLTSLPILPDSLVELYCYGNKLTSVPINATDRQWMTQHNNQLKLLNRINIINKIYENR